MTDAYYADYNDVLPKDWKWKSFTPKEIACKGSGELVICEDALYALQDFRDLVGVPVIINSAYRSAQHNANIGGAINSAHTKGMAFDVKITDKLTRDMIKKVAKVVGFKGIGDYDTFVHIDIWKTRYWNKRKTVV